MLITSLMERLVININHSANTAFLMHRRHASDTIDLAVGKTKSCPHDSRKKTENPTFMYIYILCCVLLAQSCLSLCDPMDCSPSGSSVYGIHQASPGRNIGVGCHALLQGIFLTQGSNLGLMHCRWILYHLSYQGIKNIVSLQI